MSLVFLVSLAARNDAVKVQRHLESQQAGLAERFQKDLADCWASIIAHPRGYQVRYRRFRYAPLAVFKYQVIYSVGRKAVVIHRVRHAHQRPLKRYAG